MEVVAAFESEAVAPSAWSGFTVFRTLDTAYDMMGRKLRESLRHGDAATIYTLTQYSYDAAGRLDCTAVRMNPAAFGSPPASACAQGPQGAHGPDRITRNIYDLADQRLQVRVGVGTPIEGAQATWAYNLAGQVTTMIDGNGNRADLVYDGHGRQICWMFPSTARAANYNDATQASALATAGALSGAIDSGQCASGDYEAYGYDPNGNRTSLRKRDNTTLAYSYDALNRVTVKTVPERPAPHPYPLTAAQTRDVYYSYDLRNLQLSARLDSPSGEGIANAYDGFGRLASSTTDISGLNRTLSYHYDRNGGRTRITHPDGVSFDTVHDGLGRTTSIADPASVRFILGYAPHGGPIGVIRNNTTMVI
ncbi:MAG TPA: hypothetical protein VMS43_10900, partial [Allosphingosinicella sp.]|nr:hypothetical protein [Allosphingosinicella sp.]